MKIFLQLKHWQIFGLFMLLAFISQYGMMDSVIMSGNSQKITFTVLPVVMILMAGLFFGWLYSLGVSLYKKLPKAIIMNLTRFKILLTIPVIYTICISFFIIYMYSGIFSNVQVDYRISILILPLHFLSMFCIFYCFYFDAKILKTIECQRSVTFGDFIVEFFLFWFFPIGVWIIQPRINKLFSKAECD